MGTKAKGYTEINYWSNRQQPNAQLKAPDSIIYYVKNNIMGCNRVLEFGPGVGRIFPAYEALTDIHCFDITDRHAGALVYAAETNKLALHFTKGTKVGVTPYSVKEFDAVVCVQVLLHQRPHYIRKVMEELLRIGRKVIVITLNYKKGRELAPHCFNHNYLEICKAKKWSVSNVGYERAIGSIMIDDPEHIYFTYN